MSQNLSSAAVVIGALRVNIKYETKQNVGAKRPLDLIIVVKCNH